jgi:hypothetical protein
MYKQPWKTNQSKARINMLELQFLGHIFARFLPYREVQSWGWDSSAADSRLLATLFTALKSSPPTTLPVTIFCIQPHFHQNPSTLLLSLLQRQICFKWQPIPWGPPGLCCLSPTAPKSIRTEELLLQASHKCNCQRTVAQLTPHNLSKQKIWIWPKQKQHKYQ